jgi:hypothetical protein
LVRLLLPWDLFELSLVLPLNPMPRVYGRSPLVLNWQRSQNLIPPARLAHPRGVCAQIARRRRFLCPQPKANTYADSNCVLGFVKNPEPKHDENRQHTEKTQVGCIGRPVLTK